MNMKKKSWDRLNDIEKRAAIKFRQRQDKKAGTKGRLTYKFYETGIGKAVEVKHSITKASKNITDYDSW
jgi:hypothetical protein